MRRYEGAGVLFDIHTDIGEGPSWDAGAGQLSWVDILGGRVYVANLERIVDVFEIGAHVGAALPAAGGGFLVARRDGFVRLAADGGQVPLALPLEHQPDLRFNDAKCDPRGRAWAGTMSYEFSLDRGVLYRLDGRTAMPEITSVGLSNGLGWSPDGRTMYLADSWARRISAYDFDMDAGRTSGGRTLVDFSGDEAVPDGLSVDDEGCLWVAMWGGWEVRRYAPDGRQVGAVPLPVGQPSSCCFAGDLLVITTAANGLDEAALLAQPHAGALFSVRTGVTGPSATPWIAG